MEFELQVYVQIAGSVHFRHFQNKCKVLETGHAFVIHNKGPSCLTDHDYRTQRGKLIGCQC